MNDVTYVEAARALGERVMKEGLAEKLSVEQNVNHMYRLAVSRQPTEEVRSILVGAYGDYLSEYQMDRQAALDLVSEGESLRDETGHFSVSRLSDGCEFNFKFGWNNNKRLSP